MATSTGARKASRGTPKQTEWAHEFDLHEYVWPAVCGESRERYQRVAALVEAAARDAHKLCGGTMADGRTRSHAPAFAGAHADSHKSQIRHALVHLLNAGMPGFLTTGRP